MYCFYMTWHVCTYVINWRMIHTVYSMYTVHHVWYVHHGCMYIHTDIHRHTQLLGVPIKLVQLIVGHCQLVGHYIHVISYFPILCWFQPYFLSNNWYTLLPASLISDWDKILVFHTFASHTIKISSPFLFKFLGNPLNGLRMKLYISCSHVKIFKFLLLRILSIKLMSIYVESKCIYCLFFFFYVCLYWQYAMQKL
jgi:hypothetical protein